ncbi:MAG: hypothetical protein Q4C60_09585 [Eubacteriales bacterium]|nr:hypothetical protein [Eubacteriales bacterium]
MQFDVYLQTNIRTVRSSEGMIGAVLEMPRDPEPVRRAYFEPVNANRGTAELLALRLAARHIKPDQDSRIVIHTDSAYVSGSLYWLKTWRAGGWRRPNGKPVANAQIWEEIAQGLVGNQYVAICEEGKPSEWRGWLRAQLTARGG